MFTPPYSQFRWSAATAIAAIIGVVFVLQAIETVWLHSNLLSHFGALSITGMKGGAIWQLLTYAFLHTSIWDVILNLLVILMLGFPLQAEIGSRAFATVVALLAVAGGLMFSLVHLTTGGVLIGASAIGVGLITLYCLSYPERPITLLLFFILPVTLLPRWILYFTLALNLFGFFFSEIAPGNMGNGAYSAQLGAMLAALAISRWCLRSNIPEASFTMKIVPPEGTQKKVFFKGFFKNSSTPSPANNTKALKTKGAQRDELKKETDRILDKINTHGFGALSEKEKAILTKAKDILGK